MIMLNKEMRYLHDQHLLQQHPLLQPRMRAILLDWLMEVSCPHRASAPARSESLPLGEAGGRARTVRVCS